MPCRFRLHPENQHTLWLCWAPRTCAFRARTKQDVIALEKGGQSDLKEAHLGTQGKCPVEMFVYRGLEAWIEFELAGREEQQLQRDARHELCTAFLTIHKLLYSL